MSGERPAKRIRQACEPCRRKKSRCPGEKPICSHCDRLRQACFYAEEFHRAERLSQPPVSQPPLSESNQLEERLRFVESQLAQVVSSQTSVNRSLSRQESGTASPHFQQSPGSWPKTSASTCCLPNRDVIVLSAEIYLLYCDAQPLPLFHRQTFLQTIEQRDPELLFAVLALTARFMDGRDVPVNACENYVEASRSTVMQKVCEGSVELSTLQALCLLSLVDFTNGNTRRASMHSSLAISLAHNAELTYECRGPLLNTIREERRRCFWSLFLLKRLHGADFGILDFTGEETFPWYPESTGKPSVPDAEASLDRGIISCEIQLSEIWFKITRYAKRRGKPNSFPPWSPQSEYAVIMAQQVESETRMPPFHRFRPAEFSKKSVEELQNNRDYWGPWIFTQFIYHTNLCLLNHPLLLSLRLRNIKSPIPEMFLQSTSDLISSHARWITRLIGMLEAKSFKVTDPFLAHCAAIVATILLQESFKEEEREEKMANFESCLRFIRTFSEWPHVTRIAEKLIKLRETVSTAYGNDPSRGLLIDLGQFWEILEYSSSSELPESKASLFGPTLRSGDRGNVREMTHTSSLPQPTRVDAQDFAGAESLARLQGQVFTPILYSDDELAVLTESFFQQRGDMDGMGGLNDWWSAGNL